MTNVNPIRFTLSDNINVIVKEVTNNKYDFELIFSNGSRKTFIWMQGSPIEFINRRGETDAFIIDAIKEFTSIRNIVL